jgi:hypothetical protein
MKNEERVSSHTSALLSSLSMQDPCPGKDMSATPEELWMTHYKAPKGWMTPSLPGVRA